jgi:hypothetical protein
MPLRTISLFTYRTKGGGWTAAQLGVLEFVHALKKQDLEGTARVLVKGGEATRRLAAQNASDAFDWFAEMVVPLLREELATTKVVLVPIPDCGCTEDVIESRTNALAVAVARQEGAVVVSDILRWRRRMPPARSGQGARDPVSIYQNLRLRSDWSPVSRPYVLVDDVVTTGGHLRACAAFLHDHGARVERAICAAKSDTDPPEDPFGRRVDELPDFNMPRHLPRQIW